MQTYQVINTLTNEIIRRDLSYDQAVDVINMSSMPDRYKVIPQYSDSERGQTVTQLPDDYVENNEYVVIVENSVTRHFTVTAESLTDALRILSTKSELAQNKAISIRKV